ncbi:L-fuculose-phosphate aldolase [Microbispora rosea]|uniref:L-fuculose-phosphate aldolase n=1 Tax=Microbispora rosea TaxID=58117 RepID=A0A1N7B4N5_9ACTN|nr:class II aldolase/adducin family protein [Microbispora rosea]GIH50983.1 L-fuculose phosphate aldolase [Microbispora rosea subsp. rosea]SIR46248.1 L-fuculose-phosphate aldolase [Microbispora rosea]
MTSTLTAPVREGEWLKAGEPALTPADAAVRAELVQAVRVLHQLGALQNPYSANASVRLPDSPGHLLINAKGLPADIGEQDFGVITLDGDLVAGKLGPGVRQVLQMHILAYTRPEVNAVIHTHSTHATAFALAHRPIPANYEPLVNRGQTRDIPCAPYRARNNGDLGASIAGLLAEHPDTKAVLLANHGLLAFDDSPMSTARLVATIEETATLEIHAAALGGSKPIAP